MGAPKAVAGARCLKLPVADAAAIGHLNFLKKGLGKSSYAGSPHDGISVAQHALPNKKLPTTEGAVAHGEVRLFRLPSLSNSLPPCCPFLWLLPRLCPGAGATSAPPNLIDSQRSLWRSDCSAFESLAAIQQHGPSATRQVAEPTIALGIVVFSVATIAFLPIIMLQGLG